MQARRPTCHEQGPGGVVGVGHRHECQACPAPPATRAGWFRLSNTVHFLKNESNTTRSIGNEHALLKSCLDGTCRPAEVSPEKSLQRAGGVSLGTTHGLQGVPAQGSACFPPTGRRACMRTLHFTFSLAITIIFKSQSIGRSVSQGGRQKTKGECCGNPVRTGTRTRGGGISLFRELEKEIRAPAMASVATATAQASFVLFWGVCAGRGRVCVCVV